MRKLKVFAVNKKKTQADQVIVSEEEILQSDDVSYNKELIVYLAFINYRIQGHF